mgnify:CR=1 FL=1
MENFANYSELKTKLEAISNDWKSKESYYAANNIGFGSAGYISIEMTRGWLVKNRTIGCTREFNSYGRKIWQFFSKSTNAMVDELAELMQNEIDKSGITDLKISVVLI